MPLKWYLFNRKMVFNGQSCLVIDFSDVYFLRIIRFRTVGPHTPNWGGLDIENYCTIRVSPECQHRGLRFLLHFCQKIKGRGCGFINDHNELISIRTLMKDAREVLVR